MFCFVKFVICIVVVWTCLLIGVSSKPIDNAISDEINLIDAKIIPPNTSLIDHPPFQSNVGEIKSEAAKPRRIGKFFSSLPFLTGLGVGTLATSSAIAGSGALQSTSPIGTTRLPRPVPTNLIESNAASNIISTIPQRAALPTPHHYLNIYDSSYPYVALSTTLLDQSLRSIYNVLEKLRSQLVQNETSTVPTTTEQLPTSSSTTTESIEEVSEGEETEKVEVFNRDTRDDRMHFFNLSILQDVIRETIKEVNQDINKRQAEVMTDAPVTEDAEPVTLPPTTTTTTPAPTTTTTPLPTTTPMPTTLPTTASTTSTTTSTTAIPIPQSSTNGPFEGYYGGNPQDINGVDLIHPVQSIPSIPAIPSSSYGHPNEIYWPPIYEPAEFFKHHSYNHETIYSDPASDHAADNSYPSYPDPWILQSYSRSKKFSKDMKSLDRKNDFFPSALILSNKKQG